MATTTSTPEFTDLIGNDNPFPNLDSFSFDNQAALDAAAGLDWTLTTLSASQIVFQSGAYELTVSGSGMSPVSSLSQLEDAIIDGLANGDLNQVDLTQNGSSIFNIAISGTSYTITSGDQTIILDGAVPASLDEISAIIAAIAAIDEAGSQSEADTAFDAMLTLLDTYGIDDISILDGSTEVLGAALSDTEITLRVEGYEFQAVGTFPSETEILEYLYDTFGGQNSLTLTLYDSSGAEVMSTSGDDYYLGFGYTPSQAGTYYIGVSGETIGDVNYDLSFDNYNSYYYPYSDLFEGADAPGDTTTGYFLEDNGWVVGLLEAVQDDDWYEVYIDPTGWQFPYDQIYLSLYADIEEPIIDGEDIPGLSFTSLTVTNPSDDVIAQISDIQDFDDLDDALDTLETSSTTLDFSSLSVTSSVTGVTANIGTGSVTEQSNPAYLVSTSYQHIIGSNGIDTLTGNALDNELSGGAGGDNIFGGSGEDTIMGEGGADNLYGGAHDDYLDGGFANDNLFGGDGDDTLLGGGSTDQLFGGAGSDDMDGGDQSDTYFIDGDDYVSDSGSTGYDKAQINDAAGVFVDVSYWYGVERVNGFTGDDEIDATYLYDNILLFGDDGDDILTGGDGDDVLIGGDGDDTLSGGWGNDILLGNAGNDYFNGGEGNDTFFVGETGDSADGGGGFDKVVITETAGLTLNVGSWLSIERINGLTGDDTIDATGMATSITLVGGAGNDMLTGGSAGDTFYGGTGSDTMMGNGGADALIGSAGDDILNGGAGNDFYLGGADTDSFQWSDSFGRDVVQDYVDGVDRLDFSTHTGVNSLADLQISQSGLHTIITLTAGGLDQITLVNTTAAQVTGTDFDFV